MDFKGSTVPLHSYRRDSIEPPHYTQDSYIKDMYTDVYKPMLSECIGDTMTNSDLKLHDQWIVRRKRIIYFLTIATVFAVVLCAFSLIYVLPNLYGDEDVQTRTVPEALVGDEEPNLDLENEPINYVTGSNDFKEVVVGPSSISEAPNLNSNDNDSNDSPVPQMPTLQGDDYNNLGGDVVTGESDDFYDFCIISAIPRYQKYSKTCNSVVFREVETVDPTLYYSHKDLDLGGIINVRITSPLSEDLVQKVLETFPNVQKLTICIDQLCFGMKEKDIEKLPIINLPNVHTLEIINSTLCPLASWVFNKWSLPSIEKLTIRQANFPIKVFQSMGNFLERHNDTLTSVDLKSCQCGKTICNNALPVIPSHHNKRRHKSIHRVTDTTTGYRTTTN